MILFCQAAIVVGLSVGVQCSAPLPARVTVYDPALCPPATECLQTNGDGFFASMAAVGPDWYGQMAACPPQLFGQTITLAGVGVVWCGDSFGSIDGVPVDTVRPDHIKVDIFWPVAEQGEPAWNYWLVDWQ